MDGSSCSLLLVCFRFQKHAASASNTTVPTPAPTAIPALAPVDRGGGIFVDDPMKLDAGRGWYTVVIMTDGWIVLVWITVDNGTPDIMSDPNPDAGIMIDGEDAYVVWEL